MEAEAEAEVNIAVKPVDRDQAELVFPAEAEAGCHYLFCHSRGQQTDPKLDRISVGSLVVPKVQGDALYSKRLKESFHGIMPVIDLSCHKAKSL